MRRLILIALHFGFISHAAAHTEEGAHHWWTLDPWVWLPMAIALALYVRGLVVLRAKQSSQAARTTQPYAIASFAFAMTALFFALIWPLDALAELSFAAHMAQHMLLIVVAAPLLALAHPAMPMIIAMPSSWRRLNARLGRLYQALQLLMRPSIAFAVHSIVIWLWHAPLLFEWALRWQWVHVLEHISFLASGLLFWAALQRTGRAGGEGYGVASLWVLSILLHTGLLGALITFSPKLLYPAYMQTRVGSLTPMEDQQLAGLLMWIPAGFCYLIAGVAYAAAWLRSAEKDRQSTSPERHIIR